MKFPRFLTTASIFLNLVFLSFIFSGFISNDTPAVTQDGGLTFGEYRYMNPNNTNKAKTNGFVLVNVRAKVPGARGHIVGLVDESSEPEAKVAFTSVNYTTKEENAQRYGTITFPVQKGNYWKIEQVQKAGPAGSLEIEVYWVSVK